MPNDNVKVTYNGPLDFTIGGLGRLIPGKAYDVTPEMAEQLSSTRWFTVGEALEKPSEDKPKPKSEPKKEAGS